MPSVTYEIERADFQSKPTIYQYKVTMTDVDAALKLAAHYHGNVWNEGPEWGGREECGKCRYTVRFTTTLPLDANGAVAQPRFEVK